MAQALIAAMPPDLDLPDGYVVEWSAIDATGADVSGVVVTGISIFGTNLSGGAGGFQPPVGGWFLVPGPGA